MTISDGLPVNTMPCRSVKRLWSGHLLCAQWKSA
nr:MAG TPA: hypothetical protein [Caudoviricetes sp.]